ncbi:bifunctional nicotinamidase/pyrazinamidase [Rapidithrix thailandica]|uniref:Nicotinamidase n=1 Tax=Rapidithrix thailandica TaxID=413964 RepID=A0AAW9RU42_9BACT
MNALIVVDIQNDFVTGGALAVPQGESIIPTVNQLIDTFDLVVATKDWHPKNHGSFVDNYPGKKVGDVIDLHGLDQILWPTHCVQHTQGAEFVEGLNTKGIRRVFSKGTDTDIDSYSGFYDNGHRKATGLEEYLKDKGVKDVYIAGLAADYCVKYTALDALKVNFKTYLVKDATKGVDLNEGDVEKAFKNVQEAGGILLTSEELVG